jgi:conjugative transposon TraK protein
MAVLKNYDKKVRLAVIVCSLFLTVCVIISGGSILLANRIENDAKKEVYTLNGTVPILIHGEAVDETFDVEAKSHVELFHHLFFTLVPDDKYIDYTIKKAMYLVDETGLAQYNALKEKGFYINIIGTNSVFSIFCDSLLFDKSTTEWTYYGRQRIERRTNILIRQIVTTGKLKRVPRTENNPHGFMITNWRTVINKDIEQRQKSTNI